MPIPRGFIPVAAYSNKLSSPENYLCQEQKRRNAFAHSGDKGRQKLGRFAAEAWLSPAGFGSQRVTFLKPSILHSKKEIGQMYFIPIDIKLLEFMNYECKL
jgi:hypothetical protein